MNEKTSKLVKVSLLSAMALILMYIDFPVLPLFPWLRIDLSDVPALLAAFGFSPIVGVLVELLKNILILLIKGTSTGFVGELANFLVGAALILPAGIVYHRNKSRKTAILGMILGAVFMEVMGILANVYILLPAYGMNMDSAALMQYITIGLLPFNGIKAILVSVLTYLLYKRISVSVFKAEPNFGSKVKVTE